MPIAIPSHLAAIIHELGIAEELLVARGLSVFEEAEALELAELGEDGRRHLLAPHATTAWVSMKEAAFQEGILLSIVSAFRSIARQTEIVRYKLAAGSTIDEVMSVCAAPGFSEHHTGRAVDITTPGTAALEIEFDQTPAFAWLTRNAQRFGFHLSYPPGNSKGYQYEPWHWCFHCT
ncbi:M15 family metallopeptidase [Uliginosibacterium sp. H3]|uniref:M15 family metallopeptidase n=1 Tax=Uliginosibacterium silvisoli TaxID=3114758 RepID=A0ABU6KAV7_9RHOO|nr:M15 family metallopeptidase [Uliginosibacterium sp. H3]